MPKKLKFKPVITRIKLNPEQAVLACGCNQGTVIFDRALDESLPLAQRLEWTQLGNYYGPVCGVNKWRGNWYKCTTNWGWDAGNNQAISRFPIWKSSNANS